MTNETLLQKLNNWRPVGAGPHVLAASDESTGATATVTADRCDTLGCLVREVALKRKAGVTLQSWADRVAERVTSLAEPLQVVEVDEGRNEALLRSKQATRRGDWLLYYEFRLHGAGSATLRRYQASHVPGVHREQTAFALTHEAIARLVDELAAD